MKKKVLVISDHALHTSGVANQTRFLIEGLVKKGNLSFRQLGAAVKHNSYNTIKVNDDFFIKPVDGFGDISLIRNIIVNNKPDAILLFTDPRFFEYMFSIEDEIREVCPILWWHVWDNKPVPDFNNWMYESVDAIVCHSYLTYEMCQQSHSQKTSFVPHTLPPDLFYKMNNRKILKQRKSFLEDKSEWFNFLWLNRNIQRKRPGDLLLCWKKFLDKLYKEKGHTRANLILHTDLEEKSGINLLLLAKKLEIVENLTFSINRLETEDINTLHNISDCCINISFSEGFGLSTLQSLQTGTPIIAVKTGGLTRQVVDHETLFEHGIGLDVDFQFLNGTQKVPYLFEDYASNENIVDAMYEMYEMPAEKRKEISRKSLAYVNKSFNYNDMISAWDKIILETISSHKKRNSTIKIEEV